jgi:hypothetical protein
MEEWKGGRLEEWKGGIIKPHHPQQSSFPFFQSSSSQYVV